MKAKSKRIMGLFLALVMLIGCLPFNIIETYAAEGDVQINETNFPDNKFRSYVYQFDTNDDDILSQTEINNVDEIWIVDKDVVSLKGIEHFTKIQNLKCSRNKLTELDVSNNIALTRIDCGKNQIEKLNVSNNTALNELECSGNKLTKLDVSNNTSLTELYCGANKLTELDVSNNTALTKLNCGENQIEKLDVSNNTALTFLGCSYTQIAKIDVSKNTALTKLWVGGYKLTELDISNNTALTELYCKNSHLKKLDVSNNTALVTLNCEGGILTELDVSNNTALTSLSCSSNQLTSLKLNSYLTNEVNDLFLYQEYTIKVPRGTSELKFPEGFDASRIVGTIPGVSVNPDGKLIWDEKTTVQKIQYKLVDGSDRVVDIAVRLLETDNKPLEEATKLVEIAEKDKTKAAYDTAKEAVDKLAIGSGKTGLEERLRAVKEYLDLKDAKDKAKEEIGKLPNLTDDEKQPYIDRVNDATTIPEVEKALEDAKKADAAKLKDAKDKAKEEIGKLPNLTDDEKAPFIKQVDDATTIPEVEKALEDAKKADAAKLKDAKDKAKEEIGKLPNLTDDEKAPFIKQVDDATTIPEVEKAVEDAKNADDLKAYKEKAKEEIGNLPNLDDQEKEDFKDKVDEQTDKPGVDKVVEEAKAKDKKNL